MLAIKQTIDTLRVGKSNCNHAFLAKSKYGTIKVTSMKHIKEHACYLCGRHEVITTQIVKEANLFTFERVVERFAKED